MTIEKMLGDLYKLSQQTSQTVDQKMPVTTITKAKRLK
jgi:hypothetical protein